MVKLPELRTEGFLTLKMGMLVFALSTSQCCSKTLKRPFL